jgi:hypothetical protein
LIFHTMNFKKLNSAIPLYTQLKKMDKFILDLEKRIEVLFNSDSPTLLSVKEVLPKKDKGQSFDVNYDPYKYQREIMDSVMRKFPAGFGSHSLAEDLRGGVYKNKRQRFCFD